MEKIITITRTIVIETDQNGRKIGKNSCNSYKPKKSRKNRKRNAIKRKKRQGFKGWGYHIVYKPIPITF